MLPLAPAHLYTHTFHSDPPKKQDAVSHSSSEAEVIALDAALRLEGIPALLLCEIVLTVFGSGKPLAPTAPKLEPKRFSLNDYLAAVDFVPCTLPKSIGLAKLVIYEDNDSVIRMTVNGRSPNMRHVPRTHRVGLDSIFERIREDP